MEGERKLEEKVFRVGVIGPGGMGRERCREFQARPDAEIVAAADNNPETLNRLEQYLSEKIEGYQPGKIHRYVGEYDFIEMLNKEKLDIVGVFSPHSLHDLHCKYALRAGCHVVVEKPMANHVGDALMLARLVEGRGLHLIIHYQRHYSPLYVTARKVFREGLIGNLKRFEVYLAQRWGAGGWRGDPRFSGGGQPNDSGSHLQDIFLWITGLLPKEVEGYTSNLFTDSEGNIVEKRVEIDAHAEVLMDNGAEGTITILGNTHIGFEEWMLLEGEEGQLRIAGGKLLYTPKGQTQEQELPVSRPEGYPRSNIDNLMGLLKGEYQINYTSVINGVRTAWLTNAILATGKSPEEKKRVDCDALLAQEGYDRQYVQDLIARAERKSLW